MCPRVLFNLTPAGPFRDLPDARILEFTGGDQEEGVASLTEGGDGGQSRIILFLCLGRGEEEERGWDGRGGGRRRKDTSHFGHAG